MVVLIVSIVVVWEGFVTLATTFSEEGGGKRLMRMIGALTPL